MVSAFDQPSRQGNGLISEKRRLLEGQAVYLSDGRSRMPDSSVRGCRFIGRGLSAPNRSLPLALAKECFQAEFSLS